MIRLRTPFLAAALFASVAAVGFTPAFAQSAPTLANSGAGQTATHHHDHATEDAAWTIGRWADCLLEGRAEDHPAASEISDLVALKWLNVSDRGSKDAVVRALVNLIEQATAMRITPAGSEGIRLWQSRAYIANLTSAIYCR